MNLLLFAPHVADLDCSTCERFVVEIETGSLHRNRITNEPTPRPAGNPTPCNLCPKCDGFTAKNSTTGRKSELSDKNRRTLELYHRHRAVAIEGLDGVTRRNFGIIHEAIEQFDRQQQSTNNRLLREFVALAAFGRRGR